MGAVESLLADVNRVEKTRERDAQIEEALRREHEEERHRHLAGVRKKRLEEVREAEMGDAKRRMHGMKGSTVENSNQKDDQKLENTKFGNREETENTKLDKKKENTREAGSPSTVQPIGKFHSAHQFSADDFLTPRGGSKETAGSNKDSKNNDARPGSRKAGAGAENTKNTNRTRGSSAGSQTSNLSSVDSALFDTDDLDEHLDLEGHNLTGDLENQDLGLHDSVRLDMRGRPKEGQGMLN
jgi:hypothetical protein